jgi:hypothetical protein
MAINNFIKEVWSARIMQAKDNAHVFGAIANRSFEGEIRNGGDKVRINQLGDVTEFAVTKNADITAAQTLTDAQSELVIDQNRGFNFQVDDVDKAQQDPKVMGEAMRKAAYALAARQDTWLAAMYAQAGVGVSVGSSTVCPFTNTNPVDLTSLNVVEVFMSALEFFLGYANVNPNDVFSIIPPWVQTKLVLAGIMNKTDNTDLYTNGRIPGKMLGYDFYLSRNVSKNSASWDKTRIIIGVRGESFALAEQIVNTEAYRPELRFADAVKGQLLYGGKIIRPDLTMCLYADYTAEAA